MVVNLWIECLDIVKKVMEKREKILELILDLPIEILPKTQFLD